MAPPPQKIILKDKVEDGELDLSMSDLQDVPAKEIASIRKLHSLDLSNNHISVLPNNFVTLVNLIKLDLSKNQLKELPDNFGDLIKLKHLDLYKNQLKHLPLSFSNLKALKWLDLKDNPLMPAITNIAGPCLENKECQDCAKNIVAFYSQLQIQVEEERKIREEHRQKDLQANAMKLKQENKKGKKEKKVKAKQSKENGQISTGPSISKTADNFSDRQNESSRRIDNSARSVFSLTKFLIISLTLLVITLFILTAAKIEFVKIVEIKTIEAWNKGINYLPSNIKEVSVNFAKNIEHVHKLTGKLTDQLGPFCERGSKIIITEVTQVFKNATIAANKLYSKVFGG